MSDRIEKGLRNARQAAIRAKPPGSQPSERPQDSAQKQATPRAYRRRLVNLRNVRCGLADVVHGLEAGELDPSKSRALVYAYSTLASVISTDREQSELAERIAVLEELIRARAGDLTAGRPKEPTEGTSP